MKQGEKAIWDQHQIRLALISRDRTKLNSDYQIQMKAINSSVSNQPEILKRERAIVEAQMNTNLKELAKRDVLEIERYIKEISDYDISIKKEEKDIQKPNKEKLDLDKE